MFGHINAVPHDERIKPFCSFDLRTVEIKISPLKNRPLVRGDRLIVKERNRQAAIETRRT